MMPGGIHQWRVSGVSRVRTSRSRATMNLVSSLTDAELLPALREVRGKGIALELMGTLSAGLAARTAEEKLIGTFWACSGAAELGHRRDFMLSGAERAAICSRKCGDGGRGPKTSGGRWWGSGSVRFDGSGRYGGYDDRCCMRAGLVAAGGTEFELDDGAERHAGFSGITFGTCDVWGGSVAGDEGDT